MSLLGSTPSGQVSFYRTDTALHRRPVYGVQDFKATHGGAGRKFEPVVLA
jgi:hypothetical protein